MGLLAHNAEPHGGPFKYRSILPDVLAWVMSEATGQTFAELFSRHVWSHMAARDADIVAGIYCGLGINGQMLMIHHPANVVIAKFSTWPDRMDYRLADLTDAGVLDLCATL